MRLPKQEVIETKFYFLVTLVIALLKSQGQDDLFLNTNQTLIYLNPSFAGTNGFVRNQSIYKNFYPKTLGGVVSFGNFTMPISKN